MVRLYLVRHGESALNLTDIYYGHLDPQLTPKGRRDGEHIGKMLKGKEFRRIYSSPLKRAKETTEIILENKEFKVDERLKELNFGIFEGLTYQELKVKYPEELKKQEKDWKTYNYKTGESVEELKTRAVEFVEEILENGVGDYLIVSHWGVINILLSYYLSGGIDLYWKFNPSHRGVSIIEFNQGFPVVKGINMGDEDGIINRNIEEDRKG